MEQPKGNRNTVFRKLNHFLRNTCSFFKKSLPNIVEWHEEFTFCSGGVSPRVGSSTRDSLPSSKSRRQQTNVNGGGTSFRKVIASRRDLPYSWTPLTYTEREMHIHTKIIKRISTRLFFFFFIRLSPAECGSLILPRDSGKACIVLLAYASEAYMCYCKI